MIKKGHYSTMKVINACENESDELCDVFMKLHKFKLLAKKLKMKYYIKTFYQ